jgi:hypothetical protein
VLELHDAGGPIATNNNWRTTEIGKQSAKLNLGDSRFSVPTAELLQATAFEFGR